VRQVTDGTGANSTTATLAYLKAQTQLYLANLYLIGNPEDPGALWLTDWETDLEWTIWGTFKHTAIKRGTVSAKIGLEVATLDITWNPQPTPFTQNTQTADPKQLAQIGFYDNMPVRVWRCIMPTPGDANTLGAFELFGGTIADSVVDRGAIKFTVNSFLAVINQKVPPNVIEITNMLANYRAATPPIGLSEIPQFSVVAGSTTTRINADESSPNPGQIFADHTFDADGKGTGYLVFNSGGTNTLGGIWSAIALSTSYTDGGGSHHNEFVIYDPLPWAPTPGVDSFYVSGAFPGTQADAIAAGLPYIGFPFVPASSGAA